MAEETEDERLNRELIELLNELRVALPGVQVLFAFLLTLPFTTGFKQLSGFDRGLYFASLLLCAAASGFLIAPSAHHRLHFRRRAKKEIIMWSNRMAITGLALLSLAIAASVSVVADFLYGGVARIVVGLIVAGVIAMLWFVLPRLYTDS